MEKNIEIGAGAGEVRQPEGIDWLKRDEIAGAFAQGYKLYAWDADAEEYMPVTGYVVSADGLRVELQTDSYEPAEDSASASPSVKDELERLEKLKAELKEYRVFGMGVDELRRKLYRLEEFEASASPEPRCKCSLIAGNVVPNPECPVHVEVASPEPLCSPIPPRGTLQCLRDAINLIHSEANRSERGGDMKTAQHWRDVAAVLSGNLLAETVRMESSPASPVPEPPSADAICMTCRGTKENPGTVWDEEENADLPCPQSWHVTIGTSPEPSDMTEALQAIEHALHRDKGSYWKARAYLDKHHKFHGDVQGEDVLLMVAQVALREAEARPAVPLGEAKK